MSIWEQRKSEIMIEFSKNSECSSEEAFKINNCNFDPIPFTLHKEIVQHYVDLFATSKAGKAQANYESMLICSKSRIISSFKYYLCFVSIFKSLSQDVINSLLDLINSIDSFVTKHEADQINAIKDKVLAATPLSKEESDKYYNFLFSHHFSKAHDDLVNIISYTQTYFSNWIKVQNKEITDHELYRHLFESVIGMQYYEAYRDEFLHFGEIEIQKIENFNSNESQVDPVYPVKTKNTFGAVIFIVVVGIITGLIMSVVTIVALSFLISIFGIPLIHR